MTLDPSDPKAQEERLTERSSALMPTSFDKLVECVRIWTHGSCPIFGPVPCGGAACGLAYIGVSRFLEEHHIRPDVITGTSAGSLIGTLYTDGYNSEEIHEPSSQFGFVNTTSLATPRPSLLKTHKYQGFLRGTLHHQRIEELSILVHIIVTNLNKAETHDSIEGDLTPAVVASCPILILLKPAVTDGEQYVDGGVFMNPPARPIRESCDFLLGASLSPEMDNTPTKNILRLSGRLICIMMRANVIINLELCDVVLQIPLPSHFGVYDVSPVDIISDIGYQLMCRVYEEEEQFREIIDLLSQRGKT